MATQRWSPHKPPVTETMWLSHKSKIRERYLLRNESLDEMMEYMRREEHFCAGKSAYERHLKLWGFHKNLTEDIWRFVNLRIQERQAEKKESDVYYCGNLIDKKKVQKGVARVYTTFLESRLAPRPTTPDNVAIIPPISPMYLQSIKSNRLPWQHFCDLIEVQADLGISIQLPGDIRRIMAPYLIPESMPMNDIPGITNRIYEYFHAILPLDHDVKIFDHLNLAFASNSQESTWAFLKLTVYLLSNKLLQKPGRRYSRYDSGVKVISGEILRWFLEGNNRTFCRAILTIKTPSVKAFAETIFCSAVENESLSMMRMCLESGISPNTFVNHDGDSYTPLQLAAMKGNIKMARVLLEHKADTQARDTRVTLVAYAHYLAFPQTPLQIAAWEGNVELVKLLLSARADVNTDETCWSSALQNAAKGQHYQIVRLLLDAKADINICFGIYGCALACAIEERCCPLIKLLLDNNADVGSLGRDGITPLQSAAMIDDEEMVSELLKRGASAMQPSLGRFHRLHGAVPALQWAIKNKNKKIASLLLDAGEDINRPMSEGIHHATCMGGCYMVIKTTSKSVLSGLQADSETTNVPITTLEFAVEDSSIEMVEYLLRAGANVNSGRVEGSKGSTVLERAIKKQDHELIRILLEAGADPSKDASISVATEASDTALMLRLLQAGADINNSSVHIPTALCQATKSRNLKMVQFLLNLGADPNIGVGHWSGPPIHIATRARSIDIIEVLVQAGADCNCTRNKSCFRNPWNPLNPLQMAVLEGDLELVGYLIAAGADVNWPASKEGGRTALQQAVEIGNRHIVGFLLGLGADINAPAAEDSGCTALQAAVSREDACLVNYLLEHGASPNDQASRKRGLSALQVAAKRGSNALIKQLISVGARVNDPPGPEDGLSALQAAALSGHFATVELLLRFGASVNAPACSKGGYTALQAAVNRGNIKITELLLEYGSDVNAAASKGGISHDHKGESAFVIAARKGYVRIAKVLLAKGANLFEHGAMPALCVASRKGRIDMIKLLITQALRTPEFDQHHLQTALDAANKAGQTAAAEFLESHKVVVGSSYRLSIRER